MAFSRQLSQEGIQTTYKAIVRQIKKDNIQFSAIVFKGVSGAIVAPLVAYKLNKSCIVVRKENEKTHSYQGIEVPDDEFDTCKNYIIIDDLIDTGKTIINIIRKVDEMMVSSPKCVGIYLYDQYCQLGLDDDYLSKLTSIFVEGIVSVVLEKN